VELDHVLEVERLLLCSVADAVAAGAAVGLDGGLLI
jgi:hypothetical protein